MNNEPMSVKIRMIGHLLLAHPTTGVEARSVTGSEVDPLEDSASCFCYVGAARAVSNALDGNTWNWLKLSDACDEVIGFRNGLISGDDWDKAGPKKRKQWATKLADYKENQ